MGEPSSPTQGNIDSMQQQKYADWLSEIDCGVCRDSLGNWDIVASEQTLTFVNEQWETIMADVNYKATALYYWETA